MQFMPFGFVKYNADDNCIPCVRVAHTCELTLSMPGSDSINRPSQPGTALIINNALICIVTLKNNNKWAGCDNEEANRNGENQSIV